MLYGISTVKILYGISTVKMLHCISTVKMLNGISTVKMLYGIMYCKDVIRYYVLLTDGACPHTACIDRCRVSSYCMY